VQTNDGAGAAFGYPEPVAQRRHGAALAVRGSEVSRRDLLEHVDVEGLVGHQLLQPGVLGFEFFEPLGLVGLHTAVLGKPAMPRRLSDLQVSAHLAQFLAGPEEFVALGELADLIRRMPPRLFDAMSLFDSSSPEDRATESHNDWTTTTGSPQFRYCALSETSDNAHFLQ
jgi:hypothetical protein